ncbi:MAG: patatin-like phospholipase family protein [Clostridiaceae bacterium]
MIGLALEGGGAKGAFHMGVVKAFLEEGYKFDGVAGTSIGALNGAIIVQGDFEAGYKLWENMDNSLLFDIEEMQMKKIIDKHVDKETLSYLTSKIKDIFENKGLNTSKIRSVINNIVDEAKIRKSEMDFGIVTVSVTDFKPLELYKEDIPEGMIPDYLMASANIPVFKIEPIDGKYYIDGAFYDNLPVNLLARKGYDEIIAVRTLAVGLTRKLENPDVKVTNITPSENLGSMLNFDNAQIKTNLAMGYFDALRVLKNLSGRKYYIRPENKNTFLQKMISVPEESIVKIGNLMHISEMEPKRMLVEKIYPAIAEYLDIPVKASHQDITLGLFESMAEARGIYKYRIREFNELIEEIWNSKPKSSGNRNIKKIFSPLSDENVLNSVGEEILSTFAKK